MKVDIKREYVDVPSYISKNCDNPILIYLTDSEGERYPQYAVFKAQEGSMTYYTIPRTDLALPHSSCPSPCGAFMFYPNQSYFTHLDFSGKFDYYTGKDIGLKDASWTSHTSTLDPFDKNYMYASFMSKDRSMTRYYKISMDLKDVKEVASEDVFKYPAHQVVRHNNYLMSTGFSEKHILSRDGSIKNEPIYKVLLGNIYQHLKDKYDLYELKRPELQRFLESYACAFGDTLSDQIDNSVVGCQALEGEVLIWDLETKKMQTMKTVGANPSHIDRVGDDYFVLCNNISYVPSSRGSSHIDVFYTGTVYINKFRLVNGVFEVVSSWTSGTGYRFPTHRLYTKDGTPYIAAIGYPNRIFSIKVDSMDLNYHYDIDGVNVLDDKNDLRKFLNEDYPKYFDNPLRYSAIDVTSDSKYMILLSQTHIRFFDLEYKLMVHDIPFKVPEGYFQTTLHINNLRY